MRQFIAPTEDFIKISRTGLAQDYEAGVTSILALDNTALAANDYIVIGYEGAAQSEMVQVNSAVVPGESLSITATLFPHKSDEPITKYRYNKRKFYGCTTSGGVFSELTSYGSPSPIRVNDPQGTVFEYTGAEGYLYFKSTYFNSTTSEETAIGDSTAVAGDQSTRYCTLYAIRNQAGLTNNPFITDGVIETYRRRAENEVDGYLNAQYILPLTNSSGEFEVPFMVENCCTLLAAGYWDYKEFGKDGEGVKWLGEARSILKKLQGPGGMQLLGSDQKEMAKSATSTGVQSYPDTVDNKNGPDRKFTMGQRY